MLVPRLSRLAAILLVCTLPVWGQEAYHSWTAGFFHLLAREQFVALFLALGFGHLLGRVKVRGFTLGSTASTLLVALVLSALADQWAGVRFSIPDLVQTSSLTLFLYAVGLRVGPAFFAGLKKEGFHLVALTFITATLNFLLVWGGCRLFGIAPGFAPGMISGGYNVTAAMGVATKAVQDGTYRTPAGFTREEVIANIAAGYSLTYVFSLLGIVLLITHLPSMFGYDPVAAAKESAKKFGGSADPLPGTSQSFEIHSLLPLGVRVYQLANNEFVGRPVHQVFERCDTPVLRITRRGAVVPLIDNPVLESDDLLTVSGKVKKLLSDTTLLGPEVDDDKARLLSIDQAEIVLTSSEFFDKTLRELHESVASYGVAVRAWFRSGNELPLLPDARLQRHDVLRIVGTTETVNHAIKLLGQAVRPTDATNVVTLALGASFGYLIGLLSVTIAGIPIGLGTPAGVIIAGIVVATLRTINPHWGGPVPEGARYFLENVGLDLFVGGLGLNVAPSLVAALAHGSVGIALAVGMFGALFPPFISWLVGLYVFKMDPIVLAGAVAGSRSSTTAMKAMQEASKSAIPAFGYPVPYALSAVLALIYGYLAMVLA